ncbi:hypothetical protein IIA16_03980 [bacterium]|nr:hypothetical protein [bacterium]
MILRIEGPWEGIAGDGRLVVTTAGREPNAMCVNSWIEISPGGAMEPTSKCHELCGNIRSVGMIVGEDGPLYLCLPGSAAQIVRVDTWSADRLKWEGGWPLESGFSWCAMAMDPVAGQPVILYTTHQETVLAWFTGDRPWQQARVAMPSGNHALRIAADGTRFVLYQNGKGLWYQAIAPAR